jgi:hypothetical protein
MSDSKPTNRDLAFAHLAGWKVGASRGPFSPSEYHHPELEKAYEDGYKSGRDSYIAAVKVAETTYGYNMLVITLASDG